MVKGRIIMEQHTENISFRIGPNNFLYIDCEPNTTMTIEEGKLSTNMCKELIGNEPRPMLCDLTNVVKMTQECRKHFAGPEHAEVFTKCALLITSPISRIIGNFFLGANKPLRPTKLFTNKEEALKWLHKAI